MENVENQSWTAKDEIKFIDGLGTFSNAVQTRKTMLMNYLGNFRDREGFSPIERIEIQKHAQKAFVDECCKEWSTSAS